MQFSALSPSFFTIYLFVQENNMSWQVIWTQISTPLNGKVLAHHFNFLKEDCFCPICTSAAILGFPYNVIHIEKINIKSKWYFKKWYKSVKRKFNKRKIFWALWGWCKCSGFIHLFYFICFLHLSYRSEAPAFFSVINEHNALGLS